MRAWHRGTLSELLEREPSAIAAQLTAAAASRRLDPNPESLRSWTTSTEILREAAAAIIAAEPSASDWYYFVEFEVPRRRRRIDAAIIAHDVIFLIEWKVGANSFDRSSLWQAEQYALDMRDFHEGSRNRVIVPLLIATSAAPTEHDFAFESGLTVQAVQRTSPAELPTTVYALWRALHVPGSIAIDALAWEDSAYRPTPSIVEAASMLYEHHDVRELALAGAHNLTSTVQAVLDLIAECRTSGRRGIAFITGSPGSGKTLAGLQVVHAAELIGDPEAAGVFLSGNMPLVEVISFALADSAVRNGVKRNQARREATTFIQHEYSFRDEYAEHPSRVPSEHVVLFDEAQRAWDAKRVTAWTGGNSLRSEPQITLDVMSRLPDWSVVIAMVGSGQEINVGEAGLGEWGRALEETHRDWLVRASPAVLPAAPAPPGGRLYDSLPEGGPSVDADARLHLQMNVRSPRAERLSQWVDALLELDVDAAARSVPVEREYPMVFTRDLDAAKSWLRARADDGHRTGLLASASALRLRAWGIDPPTMRRERLWAEWFLRDRGDVRGSDQLELAATNFDCQGLELDWAALCWGNDFVPDVQSRKWGARRFRGARWTNANSDFARFILNGYRVLLTRARRGQIIWVPKPDGNDSTLEPEYFDAVADLLRATGVPALD